MARILVTGATGFIGGQLVEALLSRGEQVDCLVRRCSNPERIERLRSLGAGIVSGSVSDPGSLAAAVARAKAIYHLAGLTRTVRKSEYFECNAEGVTNVLAAAAGLPSPPTVLVVSSLAAAGPSAAGQPRTETDPCRPVSIYGKSKRAGELAAHRWADRAPISIIRPPMVIGQGDPVSLEMFRVIHRSGLHLAPGLRQPEYSVVHVADLVTAMMAIVERGERLPAGGQFEEANGRDDPDAASLANGSTAPWENGFTSRPEGRDRREACLCGQGYYFVNSGPPVTFSELGRLAARALNRRAIVLRFPAPVVWVVGAAGEAVGRVRRRASFFNWDKAREASAGHWTCSGDKIAAGLGFRPEQGMLARLEETVAWYRQAGWL